MRDRKPTVGPGAQESTYITKSTTPTTTAVPRENGAVMLDIGGYILSFRLQLISTAIVPYYVFLLDARDLQPPGATYQNFKSPPLKVLPGETLTIADPAESSEQFPRGDICGRSHFTDYLRDPFDIGIAYQLSTTDTSLTVPVGAGLAFVVARLRSERR